MVGSLLYLTMVTRPDICFAVKELSRMLDSGGREVWAAGQHLLEYVHNTHHYAILVRTPPGFSGSSDPPGTGWAGPKGPWGSTFMFMTIAENQYLTPLTTAHGANI